MNLSLYHYWRSSCSWRVRWALAIKGLEFTSLPVNLLEAEQKSSAYLSLNPMGLVPCLVVDGVPLSDSIAIIEYLDEAFPIPSLLPSGALDRAHVRGLANLIASGVQPVQNLGVMRLHSSDKQAQAEWCRHWIHKGLSAFEQQAAPRAGVYCFEDSLTLADLCLIPQIYNALRFNMDLDAYPTLARIYATARALESCRVSSPEEQPGA